MLIDKNTNIYCSFSFNPGNNGCEFFNHKFKENNINAIYKSFYSNDIEKSVEAVKTLNIKGFAVSMPFKSKIISYVDEISPEVKDIGAANTVTNTIATRRSCGSKNRVCRRERQRRRVLRERRL